MITKHDIQWAVRDTVPNTVMVRGSIEVAIFRSGDHLQSLSSTKAAEYLKASLTTELLHRIYGDTWPLIETMRALAAAVNVELGRESVTGLMLCDYVNRLHKLLVVDPFADKVAGAAKVDGGGP